MMKIGKKEEKKIQYAKTENQNIDYFDTAKNQTSNYYSPETERQKAKNCENCSDKIPHQRYLKKNCTKNWKRKIKIPFGCLTQRR